MESPASPPYASSPEAPPKRSMRSESPPPDDKEKQTFIRLLVSNTAAGCIIGKGGSTISAIQSTSGARIQLSRNQEFFPGTSDRIIMISGAFDDIIKAVELILDKVQMEAEENNDPDNKLKVKLVVPNSCCGAIIGKGGSTIKSFSEESRAAIKISPQDNGFVGLHDRLVTLTGTFEEYMQAICLILSKLSEDFHYTQSSSTPYTYAGVNFSGVHGIPVGYGIPPVAFNTMNYVSNGVGGNYPSNKSMTSQGAPTRTSLGGPDGPSNSKMIGVADDHIGAVLGRGGRSIMEIIQASGARIKISDRGDFIAGTSDRKVTITGSSEAILIAENLIMNKISSASERE